MISILTHLLTRVGAGAMNCNATFFGLKPWYAYIPNCDLTHFHVLPQNGEQSGFLLIGLAIFDDLLRIAALVAIGYIIYGGILYVTSQGSPDQTGKAQNTIINALIGLVIAIISAAVVSFIGNKLG